MQNREDWDLVVNALHYSGTIKLSGVEYDAVYVLGDGFGQIDRAWAREQCYDWSHIRDSSDAAIKRMADKIREIRNTEGDEFPRMDYDPATGESTPSILGDPAEEDKWPLLDYRKIAHGDS